ncbi:hypothetical protein L0V05_16885 [Tabrizicola sp. J26]|uniref:hypothetical protein n=1 Tax=Alitabrizicola rongguiensis TaxID=2909234 RepID=UPI001F2764C1|nr:hypothetical protein [Tabrizicola rongguiensis]MCF1710486.1 hypothetical protein [Tabrizicola rongguiensis]
MFRLVGLVARAKARDTMRKAGFGLAAVICLIVGLGFLVAAAWIALAALKGALFASIFLGLCFLGLGAILMAVAAMRPRRPTSAAPDLDSDALEALSRAAAGGPGEMERAMRGFLAQAGLTPPETGGVPSLVAAFVFGLTLALTRRR